MLSDNSAACQPRLLKHSETCEGSGAKCAEAADWLEQIGLKWERISGI